MGIVLGRRVAFSLFLLPFVGLMFYVPTRTYFWAGGDEIAEYSASAAWSTGLDAISRRPTAYMGGFVAKLLIDGRFDGYLVITEFFWLVGAVAVFSITRFITKRTTVAVVAAIIYVISPAEPSQYLGVWLNFYIVAQSLLLLATWLFLVSFKRISILFLIATCFILTIGLLMSEGGLAVSLLVPAI